MKRIKLFCFPYAGGTATIYAKWSKFLQKSVELRPVEMAGRGRRFAEPLFYNMKEVIEDLYKSIKNELDECDYMMYGHSMGTIVIYELMQKIYENAHRKPLHIFMSGRYPAHIPCGHKDVHSYPEDKFIEYITKIGGTPKELFENKELRDIFVPILRADYKVVETYECKKYDYIWDFDITVINGTEDFEVNPEDVEQWKSYTTKKCDIYYFNGGHFFIHDNIEKIAGIINREVDEVETMSVMHRM